MPNAQTLQRCSRCGERKPVSEFAWHRPSLERLHTYCRACQAEYEQADYFGSGDRDMAQATARDRARAEKHAEYLFEFFSERSCVDCGEGDPVVLEFDHLRDKRFDILQGLSDRTWQEIRDEIAKCEVVCANCHRLRTAHRAGSGYIAALRRRQAEFLSGEDDCSRRKRGRYRKAGTKPSP